MKLGSHSPIVVLGKQLPLLWLDLDRIDRQDAPVCPRSS
ncbi:MAG: hypothetical protein ACI835_003380 [Planctomycetota bacterium]|jgi:hypothetical protein